MKTKAISSAAAMKSEIRVLVEVQLCAATFESP